MGVSPSVLAHRASQNADHQRLFTLLPSVGLAYTQPLSDATLQQWPVEGVWSDAKTYQSFTELLTDCLAQPCSSEYLLHYLQKAGNEGRTFNLYVEGHSLSDAQLLSMLPYLTITAHNQPVLRILLALNSKQLANPALTPLTHRLLVPISPPIRRGRTLPSIVALLAISGAVGVFWWIIPTLKAPALSPVESTTTSNRPLIHEQANNDSADGARLPTYAAVAEAVSEVSLSLAQQKTTLAVEEEQAVQLFVEQWRNAWALKKAEAYLSFYDSGYTGLAHLTPVQWQQNRREKFADVQHIQLELGPMRVWQEGEQLHVRFWQLYRSEGYRDNTDKELVLVPFADSWQIVDEINHTVIPLPADED